MIRAIAPVYLTWLGYREAHVLDRKEAAALIRSARRNARMRRMKTKVQITYERDTRVTTVRSPDPMLSCCISHKPMMPDLIHSRWEV